MKKSKLSSLLGSRDYIKLNTNLVIAVGVHAAIFISFIVNQPPKYYDPDNFNYFNKDYFNSIFHFTRNDFKNIEDCLTSKGLMIINKIGMPRTKVYKFDESAIAKLCNYGIIDIYGDKYLEEQKRNKVAHEFYDKIQ